MQDIKMMHDFLKPIHDKYENIYFVLAGMPFKNTNTKYRMFGFTSFNISI